MTRLRKGIGQSFLTALRHRLSVSVRPVAEIVAKGLCFGLLAVSFAPYQAATADEAAQLPTPAVSSFEHEDAVVPSAIETQPVVAHRPKQANFELEQVSHESRRMADWVVDSGDSRGMPFALVDKRDAKVFVFDADGRLRGAAPALLGMARGDDLVPGIGDRALSSIRPEERTTPAGRFVASMGRNLGGKHILWVDYAGAVSMHPVVTSKPKERRVQRLATPSPLDNRISYGCINVPAKFFDNIVRPAFSGTNGVVYVMPETKLAHEVFMSYGIEEHTRTQTTSQPVPVQ